MYVVCRIAQYASRTTQYDNGDGTDYIEALLRNHDYEIVDIKEKPDICIINTCTVTAKSDYQSRQLVRRAARSGATVIATGCYAQLKPDELEMLIMNYEDEIQMQLLLCREQKERKLISPERNQRETYLWNMISDNWIMFYETELAWVQKLRDGLKN